MFMCLKLLRKKFGVMLEILVEKIGLIKSYLFKVECGLNMLFIVVVLKLVKVLNVQVEELFFEESDGVDGYSIVCCDQCKLLFSGDDGLVYVFFVQQIGVCVLLLFIVYFLCDFSYLMFKEYFGEEFIFVYEGQVEVDFMNQWIIFECGDVLYFNVQKLYCICFLGEIQVELLVVIYSDE